MPKVTVIDYGIGNILSVGRALEYCGADVAFTDNAKGVECSDYLVLPGVGAFADGMAELRERGLVDSIKEFVKKERPFLGICLGMQMMLEKSEEFGDNPGLGLIPGKVVAIPAIKEDGTVHKIPHVGWNAIYPSFGTSWEGTILNNVPANASFYFVHSYTATPEINDHRLADSQYNGQLIAAVIHDGYLYGCQFHPEKSGNLGLNLIRSFLEISH